MNKNIENLNHHIQDFLHNCKHEIDDYKHVNFVIQKYLKDKDSVTEYEKDYIRLKLQDYLKIATSGVIVALPAGSILLPILLKYADRFGIDMIPSSFKKKKDNIIK